MGPAAADDNAARFGLAHSSAGLIHTLARRAIVLFVLLALPILGSASGQADSDLSAEEARGKAIFESGKSSRGEQITAIVGHGEIALPGSALPCASCHGRDGRGRAEAGVVPSDLTWTELTKPYGHVHDNGRRHPPFTDSSFLRALREGIDPAGNLLDPAMPRFQLSDADANALLAFVKRLGSLSDPGIGPQTLRIGLLLPAAGGLAEDTGAALEQMLQAYFDRLNKAGGIHRRELRLIVRKLDLRDGASVAERLRDDDLFAVLAAIPPSRQQAVGGVFARDGIPLFNLLPAGVGAGGGETAHYLLPGPDEEARTLVDLAARLPGKGHAALAVLHGGGSEGAAFAGVVERQAARQGLGQVRRFAAPSSAEQAASLVAALRDHAVKWVVWAASGRALPDFAGAAMAASYQAALLVPGTIAGNKLFSLDRRLRGKLFVAYSLLPVDWHGPGSEDFQELRQSAGLQHLPTLPQVIAYAAARVMADALKRGGRSLTRRSYIKALQATRDFETGVMPPVSFGPERAVGLLGGYVAEVDLEGQRLLPVGRWIPGRGRENLPPAPATAASQP